MNHMYQTPCCSYMPATSPTLHTRVINFIGAPGAGKSTAAASVFVLMKRAGISCELINEYAKQLVWRESHGMLNNQVYILAKQYEQQERLRGKVNYIITDSPLLLNHYYNTKRPAPVKTLEPLVYELFGSFDNTIFYVKGTKAYDPVGRYQTEDEAAQCGIEIKNMLDGSAFEYYTINSNTSPERIYELIMYEQNQF